MKPFRLSYPVTVTGWDGKIQTKIEPEQYLPELQNLKENGIDEVMINGYFAMLDTAFDLDEDSKRLGAVLDGMKMRPNQLHGWAGLYTPLDQDQAQAQKQLIRQAKYAANMNSSLVVLHPCLYLEPNCRKNGVSDNEMFASQVEKYGEETVYRTIAENLRVAGDAAQKMGVCFALENGDRFHVLMDHISLPKLVRLTDHPAIGYCLDSGHAHCCGQTSIREWLQIMGDKLLTTHFHDNRGPRFAPTDGFISPVPIDEHMPVGFGTIPWIDVIQALWAIGYDRTVNFETGGWPCKDGLAQAIRYWRMMEKMAEIKKCQ